MAVQIVANTRLGALRAELLVANAPEPREEVEHVVDTMIGLEPRSRARSCATGSADEVTTTRSG